MSVPRLIVAGVEPGPALDLVAGALLAGFGEQRAARAVLLGFDLPLWRLIYDVPPRAPRALDPALHSRHGRRRALRPLDATRMDLALVRRRAPAARRLGGRERLAAARLGAHALDAPVVLVLDARDRGASAAAAVYGTRALAGQIEIGGIVLVGGDDSPAGAELQEALRRDVGLPRAGPHPAAAHRAVRAPARGRERHRAYARRPAPRRRRCARSCREAATYLQLDEIAAVAARRGFRADGAAPPAAGRDFGDRPLGRGRLGAAAAAPDARERRRAAGDGRQSRAAQHRARPRAARSMRRPAASGHARRAAASAPSPTTRRCCRSCAPPSTTACRCWRSAAAPCSCCSASPTVVAAATICSVSCRPRPSCSNGTTGRATCALDATRANPFDDG